MHGKAILASPGQGPAQCPPSPSDRSTTATQNVPRANLFVALVRSTPTIGSARHSIDGVGEVCGFCT
jgi:hypothetical protein